MKIGMGKDGLRPGPDAWRGKRSEVGEKSRRSPAQGMFNVLGGCAGKGPRSGWSQPSNRRREEAAEAPSAHQPQGEGGKAKRVSRSASEDERPEFLAWVPGSVRHLLGNDVIVRLPVHRIESVAGGAMLDPGSASRSGRALILVVRRRESRARSLANKPGRGWTLQFSGLETLEKARQRIQLFTNP